MPRDLTSATQGRLTAILIAVFVAILACSATASAATTGQARHTNRRPSAVHTGKRTASDVKKGLAARKAAEKRAAVKKAAEKKAAAKHKAAKSPVKKVTTTKPSSPSSTVFSFGTVTTSSNGSVVTSPASGTATTATPATTTAAATPAVSTTATPASTPSSSGPVSAPANGSVLWGALTGTQFDGGQQAPWDMNVVSDFENQDAAGKGMSIIPFYDDFLNCPNDQAKQVDSSCTNESFPWTPFNSIRAHGSIPMISWGSQTLQDGYADTASDPNFTLANVAAGDYDSYITAWAQKAASWGHPFFLRFDWEMNGNWFPWSVGSNGNSAADYVAAWRHVHNIFVANGATNATWVWCPNAGYASQLAALYPGDAYVDWTCMDAYNFGTTQGNQWASWDQVAGGDYSTITQSIAPSKPMMIGEFNSTNSGGNQASWLSNTLAEIPVKYPQIKAVVLFDAAADGSDFQLESNQSAVSAFSAGINNPAYATNTFGNLGGGAVTPQ